MMGPLAELCGNIPHSFSAFGCFRRIQEFLLLDERIDPRKFSNTAHNEFPETSESIPEVMMEGTALTTVEKVGLDGSQVVISEGSFNWGEKAVLSGITTSFLRHESGSLTMVVGPVGSGKSSLLKAILGETSSSMGVVSLSSSEVAFCDQTPWVMNATIRANIIAESREFDSAWFDTVVKACDLAIDFARLPEGDVTNVGDKGVKLSGGQKQRIVSAM